MTGLVLNTILSAILVMVVHHLQVIRYLKVDLLFYFDIARHGQPSPSPRHLRPLPLLLALPSPSPGTVPSPAAPPRRSLRRLGRRPGRSWRRRQCWGERGWGELSPFVGFWAAGEEEGGERRGEHSLRQGQSCPPSSATIRGPLSRDLCMREVEVGGCGTRGGRRG